MSWLEHHEHSEQLASAAQVAWLQGKRTEARDLYAKAADAEDRALVDLDKSKVRTVGISAVSAASLHYKAANRARAEEVAAGWLSKDYLPGFAKAQLRSLLRFIWVGDQALPAEEAAPKTVSYIIDASQRGQRERGLLQTEGRSNERDFLADLAQQQLMYRAPRSLASVLKRHSSMQQLVNKEAA